MQPSRRTRSPQARRGLHRWALGVVALTLAAGLGGCTGRADDGANAGSAADQGAAEDPAGRPVSGLADGAAGSASFTSIDALRKQVVTGSVTVETDSVLTAAHRVAGIATAAGGVVTDEQTDAGLDGGDSTGTVSTLTVRVPPDSYDSTVAAVTALGHLVTQSRTTADVTDEYVDVQARVASQEASLDRLLALVNTAAQLDDVLSLENQIAQRQSDLDALKARMASLDAEVDLATIVVTLTDNEDVAAAAAARTGFLGGLQRGWDAFAGATEVALTAIGATLPFLLLFGLVYVAARPLVARYRRRAQVVRPVEQ